MGTENGKGVVTRRLKIRIVRIESAHGVDLVVGGRLFKEAGHPRPDLPVYTGTPEKGSRVWVSYGKSLRMIETGWYEPYIRKTFRKEEVIEWLKSQ